MSIFFISLGIIFLIIVLFCYLLGKDGLENIKGGYDRLNMLNYKNKNYGKNKHSRITP